MSSWEGAAAEKAPCFRQLKSVLAPAGEKEGEILYRNIPLRDTDHRTQSQEIGFVMQNPDNQIVTDKVWHELAFGLESLGYDNATHPPSGGRDGKLFWHPEVVL